MASLEKVSLLLSVLTVIFGSTSMFSDSWITGPGWRIGFIKACGPFGICMSYLKILSDLGSMSETVSNFSPRAGEALSNFASFANNLDVYYVIGVIFCIYLPLITIFVATVLKSMSLCKGPSELRDATATVCTWIATYHGLFLLVFFIVLGVIKSNFKIYRNPEEFDSPNHEDLKATVKIPAYFGWSAYTGLLSVLCCLASAITSCPVCKKGGSGDTEQPDEPVVLLDNMA